jgi:HEAT repeat protein
MAPDNSQHALRAWLDENPAEFARAAIRQLGRDPDGPASRILAALLSRGECYLSYLTDPAELAREEAVNAARLLAAQDKRFYVKLSDAADESAPDDRVTRVLQIAEALGAASLMVPWLRRMTNHPDGYIRQRAVMIMCQNGGNPRLVERQLHSADPRVRANAVESLWNVNTPAARTLLEFGTLDPHHRVATNALLGLFLQGDSSALERLNKQTRHRSPAFRIAAAWALGMTRRPEAWPALNALRDDPVAPVRESAIEALEKIPHREMAPEPVQKPEPQQPETQPEVTLPTPSFRMVS